MKTKLCLLLAVLILFCPVLALAQTQIKAEVDKVKLSTDEALVYKVVVTSSETRLPPVQPPKFLGFRIVSQANSSTMSFTKGQIKTILVYAFILSPVQTGKIKIDPSNIKMGDKLYTTQSFEIEVSQGKQSPLPPQEKKLLPPGSIPPGSEEPQVTL